MEQTIQTINPATEEIINTYAMMPWEQLDQILQSVHAGYLNWRKLPLVEKQNYIHALGEQLTKQREVFANMITLEMGKPIIQALGEVDKCVNYCHYIAEQAEGLLTPRNVATEHHKSYVTYEPQGIVFAIMPWNFPLWQVIRFIVPTLLAGNAVILSHAPISTGCSLMIHQLLKELGIIAFSSIINNHENAAKIIADSRVIGVTLTGSEQTGKIIGSLAGQALKKCVLELGGSDPYLILEDADLEHATSLCLQSRLLNAGQVCVSPKRLIVVKEVYDAFLELVQEKLAAYQMGDPKNLNTNLGPLARLDLRNKVHQQVQESIKQGAKCLLGSEIPQRKGFYYPPTLLVDVPSNSVAYNEEIFGPVVSIIKANDELDAIKIANSVRFGLGSGVFTKDLVRGERIARDELISGTSVVNAVVASDQRLPFGGTKSSGFGREISIEGIKEFLNTKTIYIDR